jgi:hypothetical protein
MDRPEDKIHPPEEIRDYISRNYPELANASSMSIGVLGNRYRIAIIDSQHVNHTIDIDPKHIDADEKNLKDKLHSGSPKARDDDRLDRARKAAAALKARSAPPKDHDRDR